MIRDKPSHRINMIYSKILLLIEIPDDINVINDLLLLCDQIQDVS